MTNQQTIFAAAPFTSQIDHRGYAVKDCKEYIWAICRKEEQAKLIVEALHAFARQA